jgi:hypothetical protein
MSCVFAGISGDAIKYQSGASSYFLAHAFDVANLERRHDLTIRGGMKIFECVFLVILKLEAYMNVSRD